MSKIYPLHNTNLGDHIQSVALYRFLGMRLGRPVTVSLVNAGRDFTDRIMEIESLLLPEGRPTYTREPANTTLEGWYVWSAPVSPIQYGFRWTPQSCLRRPGLVAYQLDSASMPDGAGADPSLIKGILNKIESLGMRPVQLNRDLSLATCASILRKAVAFVGSDSGMSHMAHTVGTPTFLYQKRHPLIWCHKPKQYVQFDSLQSFYDVTKYYFKLHADSIDLTDKETDAEAVIRFPTPAADFVRDNWVAI